MFDVKQVEQEARKQIADEKAVKAKNLLVIAYRKLDSAEQVVKNVKAEICDLIASIADGSFSA